MLSNINMEFFQAFNPLYAVPIVAVIFCAFIVYAFGFKSPVPPPSFDGIEEEKKYTKKRKAKESQKSNKVLQNGKVNGNTVNKSSSVSSKKKDVSEKHTVVEKPVTVEKSTVVDKKANKKNNKLQNEKKAPQEKKKESVPHDEPNEDGWVQLVSKKGRKNRKRDDVSASETNSTTVTKVEETNKSNDSSHVEESPKKKVELKKDNSSDLKQPTSVSKGKANTTKDEGSISNVEKQKMQSIVEAPKSDNNNIEKQPVKEAAPKGSKVLEESNKSKKKKKKNVESNASENESASKIISNVSESPPVKVITEIPASQEKPKTNPTVVAETPQSIGKVEVDRPSEVKSSNVAFDELAGLYPETKEQKKKKKVRRDH